MQAAFCRAFIAVAYILAQVAGGAAAIILAAAALALLLAAWAGVFDLATRLVVRRWRNQGKQPKSKFWRIVYEHDVRDGG